MLKKIKLVLVCAVLAMGAVACSSDDSSNSGEGSGGGKGGGGTSGEFTISVTVSSDSELQQVVAMISNGTDTKMDVNDELGDKKQWSKTYKKASNEKVIFSAQGFGDKETSKMNIKVTKGNTVIKEASAQGQILLAQVVF